MSEQKDESRGAVNNDQRQPSSRSRSLPVR